MSIRERLNRDSRQWRPQPDDVLIGIVVHRSEYEGDWGPYPVVTVEDKDGTEWIVPCWRAVLRNEINRQNPKRGDRIGIKYQGKDEQAGYERYKVIVEHRSPLDAPTVQS